MATPSRDRPLRLLRRPNQCPGALSLPALRDRPLATNAPASQPKGRLHMGVYDATGRCLAPSAACPSSLARAALRRHTPKVGAGCSNRARPDLCGGRPAMDAPTANLRPERTLIAAPAERARTGKRPLQMISSGRWNCGSSAAFDFDYDGAKANSKIGDVTKRRPAREKEVAATLYSNERAGKLDSLRTKRLRDRKYSFPRNRGD